MTPTERETESLKSLHAYYQNIVRELQEQLKQQHDKVRNQAIQDCIQALKEAGWNEDDYNGKIMFNILESLKTIS